MSTYDATEGKCIYENKMGPKIKPWGTPNVIGAKEPTLSQ